MKKTIDFIQNETLNTYKKKYSKIYIKTNILPIIDFILSSKKIVF